MAQIPESAVAPHLPLVRRLAAQLAFATPAHVQIDDLVGYGVLGLLDAVRRFDPARGASFETFAWYRIRGAMLDGLRLEDWVPVSRRQRAKLEGEHLPPPLSLDEEWSADGTGDEYAIGDLLEDSAPGPEWVVEDAEGVRRIGRWVRSLRPSLARVVEGLTGGRTPTDIARELGVGQSRVSQLRKQVRLMLLVRGTEEATMATPLTGPTAPLGIDGDQVRRLTLKGKSRAEIAARFGVTEQQLVGWCNRNGTPRPPIAPARPQPGSRTGDAGAPTDPAAVRERVEDMHRVLTADMPRPGSVMVIHPQRTQAPQTAPEGDPNVSAAPAEVVPIQPAPPQIALAPVAPADAAPSPFRSRNREGGVILPVRIEGTTLFVGAIDAEGDITDVEAELVIQWVRGKLEDRPGVEVVLEHAAS